MVKGEFTKWEQSYVKHVTAQLIISKMRKWRDYTQHVKAENVKKQMKI